MKAPVAVAATAPSEEMELAVGVPASNYPILMGNDRIVKEDGDKVKASPNGVIGVPSTRPMNTELSTSVEPPAARYGGLALTFKDISYTVMKTTCRGSKPQPHQILSPMSGHFEAGTLAAVMGPSGCGKTVLLDILANKKTGYGGVVRINGRERDHLFRRLVTYVPQVDVMPAHLTVKEAVLFASELKQERPDGVTNEMANKLAEERLAVLGLDGVANSLIGDAQVRGISGGQRRRLSLARGLASGAQIIFCDEPTSGLSATDAETCMRYMHQLAHKYGVTVIVAIHQPRQEVAGFFDQLLMMTSGPGRLVYNGPMKDVATYMEAVGYKVPRHVTPTDHFMDRITPGTRQDRVQDFLVYYQDNVDAKVIRRVDQELEYQRMTPMELLNKARESRLEYGELPPVRNSRYAVTFWRQLRLVLGRTMTLRLRDRTGVFADLAAAVVKALVVGCAFWQVGTLTGFNQICFLFITCMSCALDGLKLMPGLINERTIMKMENSEALYSQWVYIVAFSFISLAQWLVSYSLFITLLFALSGLDWEIYPHIYMWNAILSLTFDGLYLMFSSIARDSATAIVMAVPFLIIFLIYNGFTITANSVPPFMLWALRISPVAWTMEQMSVEMLGVNDPLVDRLGYQEGQFWEALAVTGTFLALFRGAQIVCLMVFNNVGK
eukprot:TRINITY_DN4576_c0_g1_i1.p1 TRINITY_DN4576_c0_g1~~TRINITY_DN4576_c0_g1_i1.p1  ORF type:complete len:667 (+),score=124.19 TRINITY_DN4576_c0_g1_i1:115-2115(+)